jgi:hypothetical protein
MAETLAELVISEVKSRRILWDMRHNSYHNGMLVDREWNASCSLLAFSRAGHVNGFPRFVRQPTSLMSLASLACDRLRRTMP